MENLLKYLEKQLETEKELLTDENIKENHLENDEIKYIENIIQTLEIHIKTVKNILNSKSCIGCVYFPYFDEPHEKCMYCNRNENNTDQLRDNYSN